ncbi:MAG: DJ-1/PfpI family protein [Nitrospinae bacterium]|nr:DJ-1/PfpI family protein [Nitrospinota bacterium]
MKKALVILAPGFEDIEALTAVDILRRGGIEVTLAGTIDGPIKGRCGIMVLTDEAIDISLNRNYEAIILPGGAEGTENLKRDQRVADLVKRHHSEGKLIAAICAAPTILSVLGLTKGKRLTSHPSFSKEFKEAVYSEERVVVDGNMVTSRGPGTAMEFAFKILELLLGPGKVAEVNKGVLAKL